MAKARCQKRKGNAFTILGLKLIIQFANAQVGKVKQALLKASGNLQRNTKGKK